MGEVLELDLSTNKRLALYLFTNVENMPDFRKKVISGELKCCILKATMVLDALQIGMAANKAVKREKLGILVTKSVLTELIYLMSSSDSISKSLKQFGAQDDDKNIVVVVIFDKDDTNFPNEIISHIKGQITSFSRIKEFHDETLIKKTYKISDTELTVSTLSDSIVSRIGGGYSVKTN